MEALIAQLMAIVAHVEVYVVLVCQILGAVALVATVVARATKTKADDEAVGAAVGYLLAVLAWLPTIGVNPKTKKLEEAYKSLKQ